MTEPNIFCDKCKRMHGKWSCPTQEGRMINDWHLRDKAILADALKEIYAIRGEDAQVAAIVLKALREGCVPGY